MLPYVILPVHPMLQQWVESVFIMKVDFTEFPFASIYKYPWSVSTHIYFTLSDEPLLVKEGEERTFRKYPSNFIIGPLLTNYVVDLGQYRHVAAIAFRPGGLHRLFQLPITEITNSELDASLVWNKDIRELSDRLRNAANNEEIFRHIEQFLLKKFSMIKPISAFDYSIAELVANNGNLAVTQVATLACMSVRQFERKALNSLGVSPKLFGRITRFTNASLYKETHPQITWSRIAYEFGFADQMHLVNDFKKFSGFTPTALVERIDPSVKLLAAIEGKVV